MTDDITQETLSRRNLLRVAGASLAGSTLGASAHAAAVEPEWHDRVDVVVCGSGAAGATAALYAAKAGARVMVLEKSGAWGGTTAKSGCHIWIPNNHELRVRGIVDERHACLQYMAHYSYPQQFKPASPQLGLDDNTYALLAAFYDNAAPMVEQMMAWDAFEFRSATIAGPEDFTPDYYDHSPYNKVPAGRGLQPHQAGVPFASGRQVVQRMRRALEAENVDIRMRMRASSLYRDDAGTIIGLAATNDSGDIVNIRADHGVIFATGCYSHNQQYLRQFQMMPVFGSCAVPTNEGDFIRIAGEVGAQLGNMAGAWRAQVVLEETLQYVAVPSAVYWPPGDSMLLVDKTGQRFVNEKRGYNDRTRQMYAFDANTVDYPHLLNFMIYDQRTADLRAGMHPIPPTPSAADFVISGDTLQELAAAIESRMRNLQEHTGGVELAEDFAARLRGSVDRFNTLARRGVDEDFGRGNYAEDRDWFRLFYERPGTGWESASSNNSTLYPLQDKGPYYAIILAPGVLGTNGGPKVNAQAQVLDWHNQVIGGLYAAGNCMAHPAANGYWGAGATIGSAMTFGKIAGEAVMASTRAAVS
jgi:3-oxosteroid 1-dehydrogenase